MDSFITGNIILEKYQIIKKLGKGGFSEVYLASNIKVGNKVAIKIMDKALYGEQVKAEKEMLITLRHSSIVLIFDIEEDEDYYYIVEEYVEGRTLADIADELSGDEITDIFRQLIEVFKFLHGHFDRPIIYRDLKPSNIMLMPNNVVKLIDFGVASPLDKAGDKSEYNYGTKSFCAPEQLCRGITDVRTDIFSMGMTLYYLLTKQDAISATFKRLPISHFRNDFSDKLAQIIYKMMDRSPMRRYQSFENISRDFYDATSAGDGGKDVQIFAKKADKVHYLAGIKRGVGTSYVAQLMANFYARNGKKVAIVEWANRDDLIKIAAKDGADEMKRSYEYRGVRGYFYTNYDYEALLDEHYDVLIVDCGTYDELVAKESDLTGRDVLLVSGASDWDLSILEDMLFDKKLDFSYIVNLADDELVDEINKVFTDRCVYPIAYNSTAYEISAENEVYLPRITGVKMSINNVDEEEEYGFFQKAKSRLKGIAK